MGSAQSAAARTSRGSKKARINRLREKQAEVAEVDKKLHALKILLYRTKVEGIMQRDKRDEEIYKLKNEAYRRRKDLVKKGKEASTAIAFEEYRSIMRNPRQKQKKAKGRKSETASSKDTDKDTKANSSASIKGTDSVPSAAKATESPKPKPPRFSTAIMLRSFNFPLATSIFSYLEAYLLKRLHIAMLQEHQQKIHRDNWNNSVSKLFMEIDPLKKESVAIKSKLKRKIDALKEYNEGMKKIYEDHLRNQELIIYRYEQAPWSSSALEEATSEAFDESFHAA